MSKKTSHNLKVFIPLVLTISFVVFYVFQVGISIEKSYLLSSYERKLQELSEENKILELSFAELTSLDNAENFLEDSDFEKITKVDYIKPIEKAVAAR